MSGTREIAGLNNMQGIDQYIIKYRALCSERLRRPLQEVLHQIKLYSLLQLSSRNGKQNPKYNSDDLKVATLAPGGGLALFISVFPGRIAGLGFRNRPFLRGHSPFSVTHPPAFTNTPRPREMQRNRIDPACKDGNCTRHGNDLCCRIFLFDIIDDFLILFLSFFLSKLPRMMITPTAP